MQVDESGIRLIVGLGNPGKEYADTRHNVGAWYIHQLAIDHHQAFKPEKKFSGEITQININTPLSCWLLFPTTFMNASGRAVQRVMKYYQLKPTQLLVIHDEIDFPVAKIRLKASGGHGGHNGLRDIIQQIGPVFYRLRIGIGHPGHKNHVSPYVLSHPSTQDRQLIKEAIHETIPLISQLIDGDFQSVMRELAKLD